ncbi:MAG: aminodeoxychorismate/anthranilate synthase component II, partial [Candidatus Marinimicrobia bacterium]|nr:aminodeoxychorismate/anthranilate synthase component II [Candidatus Neomarinimicrobiota bacterium]
MILVIDNYDSFTYNLVQYIGPITSNVKVVRNDQFKLDDIKQWDPSH